MPDEKRDERARSNGKAKPAVDPNNVSADGVSAEELHPEAEVGPTEADGVEKGHQDGPINVEDLDKKDE